jgi:hypothetical protein
MKTGDVIVAVFADSTRRLAAVFEELFTQAGFKAPPVTPGAGFSGGSGPYAYSCRDSMTVSVAPLTGSNRNFARVTVRIARGYDPCKPDRAPPPRTQHDLVLPDLTPPSGVRISRSGWGGGGGEVNSSGEMTGTSLVTSAILAHYATQLVAAGWTALAPAIGERMAGQFFQAKDASGGSWEGFLLATGGGSSVSVLLTMHPRTTP